MPSTAPALRAALVVTLLTTLAGCTAADAPPPSAAPPTSTAVPTGVVPSPAALATRFGDGQVVAGLDVVPGTYRTIDVQTPDGRDGGLLVDGSCRFGQYSDADGGLDDLVAGGTADGGRPTVTLGDAQLFRTQHCGAWVRVEESDLFDAPDTAPDSVTDGMWLVGEDLRPGTYRTDAEFTGEFVDGAFCGWEVDSTWTDWDAEVVALEFAGPGPGEVTLATGQQFVSSECGTWRLQPAS